MNSFYLFIFTVLFAPFFYAQENLKHCGADELRIETLKKNPKIAAAVVARDAQLETFTEKYVADFYKNGAQSHIKSGEATYIIPIVFHVIHNYGTENISDAQLLDGLDILNKTFRKQLADTASIVAAFQPIHADCDIEFRLAQLDPEGNCTSGINRIASPLSSIGDHSVKSLIQWPPNQYLNIYVTDQAAGLAGHCVWPSDADTIPEWDGIVVAHNYVGSIGTSTYQTSVALAHECGHYLNLHHIWGGNNVPGFYYYPCADPTKDCNIDDLVADTPPTIGWQSCNLSAASCGNTVDNVQNTMDYSYCNRMFTVGQKARMHACLNSPIAGRDNLWTPENLVLTGVDTIPGELCAADFTSDKTVVCESGANTSVQYTNTSYNGLFTAIEWTFDGGSPATSTAMNPLVNYTTPGSYTVTLKVINGSDTVEVTKPNFISVLPDNGMSYPFSESFETTSSLHGVQWFSNNMDTVNDWELTNSASFSGSTAVLLDNFNNAMSTKDELISEVIDLTGATAMNLSFKYAYTKKDSTSNDRLQLFITKNCAVNWAQKVNLTGTALETAPETTNPFFPNSTTEWKQESISLTSTYFNSNFRFKFVFSSNGGNNLFIDDINIDVTASENELVQLESSLQLFPNPTNDELNLNFQLEKSTTLSFSVVDILGKTIFDGGKGTYNEGNQQLKLDVKSISNGLYFIEISEENSSIRKPFVVGR